MLFRSKEQVLKHLQDVERPCELALEGSRWYDLIRWGIVEDALKMCIRDRTRSGLRSVFGRVNYSWKMRYMLMASFRYDGSSRFADGNQWGFFPLSLIHI